MQHGVGKEDLQAYMGYFGDEVIKMHINHEVKGFPPIFYAVATNDEPIVLLCVDYGAHVSAVHAASGIPVLAFSIMQRQHLQVDTTRRVASLLALGASSDVIPTAFYSNFCRDLPDGGPDITDMPDIEDENKKRCKDNAKLGLARNINLMQPYFLERESKLGIPTVRAHRITERRKADYLHGIPYFLIGQDVAAKQVFQKMLSLLLTARSKPLVLVSAGPSGHGKTELARSLGHLLSLDLEVVDCTIHSSSAELFGHRPPFKDSELGKPPSNFLAKHNGQRCIIFIDEFENTTADVHESLLLPFQSGVYSDHRNSNKVDCSKTIWIFATNAVDAIIESFCKLNHKTLFVTGTEDERNRLIRSLTKEIKGEFINRFKAPITGRISGYVPFLIFTPDEQAYSGAQISP